MSFLNLSVLAYGALFIGVPILMHLLKRRKPKHAMFPALRFVKRLQQSNQQRLRWRNLLLLVLRCLAVLGCAAAFARPTVASELLGNWLLLGGLGLLSVITLIATWIAFVGDSKVMGWIFGGVALSLLLGMAWIYIGIRGDGAGRLIGQEEAPVAAVVIFDTSPRMLYRSQNQTRLEAAGEFGQWLLTQFPPDSDIAVMDANAPSAVFSVNRDAAQRMIGALAVHHRSQPFTHSLSAAIRLLDSSRKQRKEIYLLTDLTQRSWGTAPDKQVRSALESDQNLQLYILDVGAEKPTNTALVETKLSSEFLSRGSPLRLETRIDRTGDAERRTVELLVEKPDSRRPIIVDGQPLLPELILRDQRDLQLEKDGSRWVAFSISGLEPGVHHGQIRLIGEDALPLDDVQYFTLEVAEPWPVLVVASRETAPRFLTAALAPYEDEEAELSVFRCDTVDADQFQNVRLEDYAAIAVLDPAAENTRFWQSLADFANRGGSVAVFLGRNAHPIKQFNDAEGGRLLPGPLVREWRAGAQDIYLAMRDTSHPMLRAFRPINVPWNDFPIFRHWVLDENIPDATAIVRFGTGQPAIYERRLGNGRVLVMTTPVSDPLNIPERPTWNYLPTGESSWPFFMLAHEMFQYLVRDSDARLNYKVGQTAVAATPGTLDTVRYQVFVPAGSWQDVTAHNGQLTIPFTEQPGAYRLRRAVASEGQRGFAVNLSVSATDLSRIDEESLNAFLGANRVRIAREREELHRDLGESRVGSELYPWLMVFVVLVLAMEYVLANRFYAQRKRGPA